MNPLRITVVGFGYWGPNYARVVTDSPAATLVSIVEPAPARRNAVAPRYRASVFTEIDYALRGEPWLSQARSCEAVMIATPVTTHYPLVKKALVAGKHVLVAKPLAATVDQAEELVELADRNGLVLQVDHTFLYTAAVRQLGQLVDSGDLGDLLYLDSVRVNLGLFQHDADVVWDLAPHDLAIFDYLIDEPPVAVSAVGADRAGSGHADVAYLTVWYESGLIAHVHVNWLSPVKVRRMMIGGSVQAVVYDDTEPSEKVKVYDSAVNFDPVAALVDYRVGDVWTPKLDMAEALAVELDHFVECVRTGGEPISGGESGVRVVRLLAAASESLAAGGVRIPV